MTEERQPNTRPGLDTKHFEPVNAERQPNTELREFEIHNRFCGENGEPCQVCRLKAEREGK